MRGASAATSPDGFQAAALFSQIKDALNEVSEQVDINFCCIFNTCYILK